MGVVLSGIRFKNSQVLSLSTLLVGVMLHSSVSAEERQGLLLNADLALHSDSNIMRI